MAALVKDQKRRKETEMMKETGKIEAQKKYRI